MLKILGLILIAVLSLTVLGFFIKNTDPYSLKAYEFIVFYSSLFLSLSGILTLSGVLVRRIRSQFFLNWKMIASALRQGIVLAFVITVIFVFLGNNLLNWQLVSMLLLAGIGGEILAALHQKRHFYETRSRKN